MTPTRPSPLRLLGAAGVLAAASAAAWFVWVGWDHEYQVDPATGVASGPYEAWQVVGCALTLLVAGVVAGVLVSPWLLAVVPPAFTAAWTVDAAASDETGLFVVGAVLVLLGASFGAAVVALVSLGLRAARGRRVPSTVGG
ncbi:hypothetical protein [Phycicoccus sonneratiae]|uniref:Uncharacterized protein n=1 Tax=Phycicoccus sonneratiae TaxID=2807628 RepID=A0ABS2CMQ0_9MICO|nr:hypothetical protein [Phycicoccus sonneraticus]MBM6401146.1 hypothetical protein [Phycicoccus sonneraticus]